MKEEPVTKYTYVGWYLPKPLYDALSIIQEGLTGPDGRPLWGSIEALATQFLIIAARRELARRVTQSRLVQPAVVVPRAMMPPTNQQP